MNLYSVILGAVAIGGLGLTIWGWSILSKSRKIKSWPTVAGKINESKTSSESANSVNSDLLPHIIFSYQVNGKTYTNVFKFPEGTHPLPEFNQAYLRRYPAGKAVTVYYNPDQPETATLEPEAQGDWMILAMGVMMTVGGLITLFIV